MFESHYNFINYNTKNKHHNYNYYNIICIIIADFNYITTCY